MEARGDSCAEKESLRVRGGGPGRVGLRGRGEPGSELERERENVEKEESSV